MERGSSTRQHESATAHHHGNGVALLLCTTCELHTPALT